MTRSIFMMFYFQERDFYFEKLRDIELMITNVSGEEAENPVDPDTEMGQLCKKVLLRENFAKI